MIDIILVCLTIRCSDIELETDSSEASSVTQDCCWFVFLWFVEKRNDDTSAMSILVTLQVWITSHFILQD